MDESLGLEVGECCGELVGVEHQGGKVQSVSVVLQVGPQLPMPGPLHDDPDGGMELTGG